MSLGCLEALGITAPLRRASSWAGGSPARSVPSWLMQGAHSQSPCRDSLMCKSRPWPQMICLHFIINAELDSRQIAKDDFLNRCCRSLVSYLSNKFQSASRCFCHCNQRRMLFGSSNYKARATQGKFILFKSVLVSPNSLLCH